MTSVPSRMRSVSRAMPPSVSQASVGPGSPSPAHGEEVVGAEEGVEARAPRPPARRRAAGRRTRPAGARRRCGASWRQATGRSRGAPSGRDGGRTRGRLRTWTSAWFSPRPKWATTAVPCAPSGQAVDDLGYTHLAAYDHVLGGDTDVHGDLGGPYTIHHPFREPLTMFAYLAGCTNLAFATSILIGPATPDRSAGQAGGRGRPAVSGGGSASASASDGTRWSTTPSACPSSTGRRSWRSRSPSCAPCGRARA